MSPPPPLPMSLPLPMSDQFSNSVPLQPPSASTAHSPTHKRKRVEDDSMGASKASDVSATAFAAGGGGGNDIEQQHAPAESGSQRGMVSQTPDMVSMTTKTKAKYDKYFGNVDTVNMYIFLASIFDPRHKVKFVKWSIEHMYSPEDATKVMASLNSCLEHMFNEYNREFTSSSVAPTINEGTAPPPLVSLTDPIIGMSRALFMQEQTSQGGHMKSELDRYLEVSHAPDAPTGQTFDVLGWWKVNCNRFLAIANMARHFGHPDLHSFFIISF